MAVCVTAGKRHMGKLDIKDREYFSDYERFAEIININVYHGEKLLLPENLVLLNRNYLMEENSVKVKERDVLMKDKVWNVIYGLEIETESDYSMPERVMLYDASEYNRQIREINKRHKDREDYESYREKKSRMKNDDFLLPTLTVVLFLGEGSWEGRQRLSQMFRRHPKMEKLMEAKFYDYGFPLIEADSVNSDNYKTDLKEFFEAMQCRRDRNALRNLFGEERFSSLASETERVIALHLNIKKLVHKMEKEELPMCKAFNDLMKEQRRDGRKEGKRETLVRDVESVMESFKVDLQSACKGLKITVSEYERYKKQMALRNGSR